MASAARVCACGRPIVATTTIVSNPGPPSLRWHPFIVDARPSLLVKKATDARSGAYAIRRKDSKSVVYVGESHVGRLWRTMSRHFQAPASFTSRAPKGGKNSFATDRPGDYEVAWRITRRGKLTKAKADQRAMSLQAAWIAAFRSAGEPLKNRDDGMAEDDSFDFGANVAPSSTREWYENPIRPSRTLIELGKLTRLGCGSSVLFWSLRHAPILAYDEAGRLFIVYAGKVVRPSSAAERREYSRTHWGRAGGGEVREGGTAPPPFVLGPAVTSITYTTRKGGDRDELVDYVHAFGEGSRRTVVYPRLATHRCRGCGPKCAAAHALALVGGSYRVNARGIVG